MYKIKSNYIKIWLRINRVKYGKNLSIIGIPIIYRYKFGSLVIGDNCVIKSSLLSNPIGIYQRTLIAARNNAEIIVGNNVGMSGVTIYALKKVVIGDYTNIGANTKILDNDFHPIDPAARLANSSEIEKRDILIGENVFIGCNSIILKGTVIGNNCVIGAGSVVCGVFPENTIIAGNPAKMIKKLS